MNQESKRPITVEDLLRLKRAEQPPAEFWNRFDHELRAKQLAALVEKRPWWRTLPRAFAGFSRYSLPMGATAVLAITFLATRDYRPATVPQTAGEDSRAQVVSVPAPLPAAPAQIETAPRYPTSPETARFAGNRRATDVSSAREVEQPDAVSAEFAGLSAEPTFVAARMEVEEVSPSARHIAANLAAAQAASPTLASGLLGAPRGFEDRAVPTRFATEPLEQVSTPVERSRARFATAMVASFNGDIRARVTSANVTRRISDDRVYDDEAIRRVGATGNSVAWRF
jgi:hypothetical protein